MDMKIYKTVMAALLSVALLSGGCAKSNLGRGEAVAVADVPMATLAEELGGEDVRVISLAPTGTSAETYEPTMKDLTDLQGCDMFLTLNTPGLERDMAEQARANDPKLKVSDMSLGVKKIYGTHGETNGHLEADPHYMASPRNALIILKTMSARMKKEYPGLRSKIDERYAVAEQRLMDLDAKVTETLKGAYGRSFVVFHPMLSYLARDYNLRQYALEDEGKEASAKEFQRRFANARISMPTVLLYEKGNADKAREVAATLGIKAVEINLKGADFEENILKAAEAIAEGAKAPIQIKE